MKTKLQTITALMFVLGIVLGSLWGFSEGVCGYVNGETSLVVIPISTVYYAGIGEILGSCWFITIPSMIVRGLV